MTEGVTQGARRGDAARAEAARGVAQQVVGSLGEGYVRLVAEALTHYAERAVAAEREACAAIADRWAHSKSCGIGGTPCEHQRLAATIAERIRQRAAAAPEGSAP